MFCTETTGLIFTIILHDIVALVALFNHAYTALSHSVSESQSVEIAEFAIFCMKSVAMVTSLEISEKEVQFDHWHVKCVHMVKRLRKSVQYI